MAEIPSEEGAHYTSSSGEDSDLDTDLAVVAASFISLDPFCSGDQDECTEVRVAPHCPNRWEELFDLWKEAVKEKFPDDEEKQARLIRALRRETENWHRVSQEKLQEKKKQKDQKKKRRPQQRDVEFPENFDWNKPYFVHSTIEGERCSPRTYKRVFGNLGMPLIDEDQQPYRHSRRTADWRISQKQHTYQVLDQSLNSLYRHRWKSR